MQWQWQLQSCVAGRVRVCTMPCGHGMAIVVGAGNVRATGSTHVRTSAVACQRGTVTIRTDASTGALVHVRQHVSMQVHGRTQR